MCKVFASILIGLALVQFNRLALRSIDSFSQMVQLFSHQLFTSIKHQKQTKDLFSIVQHKGKSIRSYMKRFNEVKIKMLHCDESVVAIVFYKGLLPKSKLYHSLVKFRPKTMAEVLRHAQKYINLEEELKVKQLKKMTNFD